MRSTCAGSAGSTKKRTGMLALLAGVEVLRREAEALGLVEVAAAASPGAMLGTACADQRRVPVRLRAKNVAS